MPTTSKQNRFQRALKRIVIPFLCVAFAASAAVTLLNEQNNELEQRQLSLLAVQSSVAIQDSIESWNLALQALRSYWLGSDYVSLEEFETYARTIGPHLRGLVALQWIDDQDVYRYAYPATTVNLEIINTSASDYPNRMAVVEETKKTRQLHVAGPLMLIEGVPGLVLYQSIYRDNVYLGSVVGVLRLDELFAQTDQVIKQQSLYGATVVTDEYILPISGSALYTIDGNRVIDAQGTIDTVNTFAALSQGFKTQRVSLGAADQTWNFYLTQLQSNINQPWSMAVYTGAVLLVIASLLFLVLLEHREWINLQTEARERDFVSLVSHQLKAPVAELMWILDTIDDKQITPRARISFLADMRTIVKQCGKLMNDLLNISRLDRGVLQIDVQHENVSDIISEVILPLREAARQKKIRIAIDVPANAVVEADRVKLIESLRNVLDNAIKFSPKDSSIELIARAQGRDTMVIEIQDHGVGIPETIQKNLFEKATLFAPKGDQQGTGAGLGLFLSKAFIERMGGTIDYRTSPQGTTFSITLPRP